MSREALTEQQIREAYKLMCNDRWTFEEISKKYYISERTLKRYFDKRKLRIKRAPRV